ncbi:MAG: spermidine/putrescine ABC transporter substrate-binding protein [Kiritimatiellaeota bacterium]|nr:spermidine/putrescine ABC transporter substrate-binding protein [Kiritimatiellota bacterium]
MKHRRRRSVVTALALVGMAFSAMAAKPRLMIYNWDAYIAPELVKEFQKKHNCTVVIDIFDSNEVLEAKMISGAANYDIIVPSSYFVERLAKQGLIQRLNLAKLPNVRHVDAEILSMLPDKKMEFSIPYMMGYSAIGYRRDKMKDFEPTWRVFGRQDLKNHCCLLNDLRETLGIALKTLGYSCNTTDEAQIKEAAKLVMTWKRIIAKFENEQYKNGLASGQYLLVQGYVCDMMQVAEEEKKKDIAVVIPQEGTQFAVDMLCIPAKAKNAELAYAFIDFVHDPANAAKNTEWVMNVCPNAPSYAMLPKSILDNKAIFPDPELKAKCELLQDVGEAILTYNHYWEMIKTKDAIE